MDTVAIYGRVSTQEQARDGYSLGEQETRLRKFADAHGWNIGACYMDAGYSGAKLDRPGISAIIEDAKARKIKKVIVYKLDRLSRRQRDTLHLIEDIFLPNGVDFVSMSETLDTSTPFGMAMIGILSVFAQLERETIRERMTIGRDARIKAGYFKGSGHIPIGFDYSRATGLQQNEDAPIVRQIFEMYNGGMSCTKIATTLNRDLNFHGARWTNDHVRRLLQNPIYIGLQRWKGEEIAVTDCVPVVTTQAFYAAQDRLQRQSIKNPIHQSAHAHVTLLGGLCYCGKCGLRYSAQADKNGKGERIYRYYCYGRIRRNHGMNGYTCSAPSWNAEKLHAIVLGEIAKLAADPSALFGENAPQTDDAERNAVVKQIEDYNRQLKRLIDLCAEGVLAADMVADKMNALKRAQNDARTRLNALDKESPAATAIQLTEALNAFKQLADTTGEMELYNVVRMLIKSIVLTDDDVAIRWNI